VFGSATAGQTICLASGSYGTFTGGAKSGMVTLKPEDGASPTIAVDFTAASNITLDGLKFTGANVSGTSTHDITIRNSNFDQAQIVFRTDTLVNANILVDGNTFSNFTKCSSCYSGRIQLVNTNPTQPDGITIQDNEFYGGDGDGIQNGGNGTRIIGNEFHDLLQFTANHTDSVQLYGSKNTLVRGNWFHDVADAVMCPDGCDHETIEYNVMKVNHSPYAMTFLSDKGSVIRHNTLWGGATCEFNLQCGVLYVGNKSVDPVSQGTTIKDNIMTRICVCQGSAPQTQTEDYNLIATQTGAGAHDIRGVPIYLGGLSPITPAGFALTAASPGHAAADDGSDIGAPGSS
jgi:hypothetical protein